MNKTEPFRPFGKTETALYLRRPNRFTVLCEKDGRTIRAFLPNPGRLHELLLPGALIRVVREGNAGRKTHFTAVAVEREGLPICLHTLRTNAIARYLIGRDAIQGLEGARVAATEIRIGKSRFDLLLKRAGKDLLLEVKSCTLFGKRVAMFPDAVTQRGTRHVEELAGIAKKGTQTAVLFIVHWPKAHLFMPDYHTDLSFARALLCHRDRVDVIPAAIRWEKDLSIYPESTRLDIPWSVVEREAKDRGSYLLVLRLRRKRRLAVGRLGTLSLPGGYYIYVGSAMANLTHRIDRHRRLRKLFHWHIDSLRSVAQLQSIFPIRSSERLECEISRALSEIADWTVAGFGSSDCQCQSHLFAMKTDPIQCPEFLEVIQHFRMDRLDGA